jgi:hypothetical protein
MPPCFQVTVCAMSVSLVLSWRERGMRTLDREWRENVVREERETKARNREEEDAKASGLTR